MKRIKKGTKIKIINAELPLYANGDIGVIKRKDPNWPDKWRVDFNQPRRVIKPDGTCCRGCGLKQLVYGDGIWPVGEDEFKILK